jgi:uncharacterized protein (DUF2252 family)
MAKDKKSGSDKKSEPAKGSGAKKGSAPRTSTGTPLAANHRYAEGRAQRELVPVEGLAELPPTSGRGDPVAILGAQDATRLQHLVALRHGRMSVSAFTFYRGAAAVMAADLATRASSGLTVQLCGDAHLSNFGIFRGPDRRLVFDMNDFDETLPGPFEWDVKRLAASLAVASRDNGFSAKDVDAATRAAVRGYRDTMAACALRSPLELHYLRMEIDSILAELGTAGRKVLTAVSAQAARKDSLKAVGKLTEVVDGRSRIKEVPPVVTRVDHLMQGEWVDRMRSFYLGYLRSLPLHRRRILDRFRVVDLAHKVVGVGSVGTRCFIVLIEDDDGHQLVMQFKEATRSVLEAHLGESEFDTSGERVVEGQRLMQTAGDVLLGWSRHEREDEAPIDFYFRQLWDGKGSLPLETAGPPNLARYGGYCGAALAISHARTGDAVLIAGYLGEDDDVLDALTEYGRGYADVNERDYAAHQAAIAEGRLQAENDA